MNLRGETATAGITDQELVNKLDTVAAEVVSLPTENAKVRAIPVPTTARRLCGDDLALDCSWKLQVRLKGDRSRWRLQPS